VNLFKPSLKQWILIGVSLYIGVTLAINLSQKKTEESIKKKSSSNKVEAPGTKPVDQENKEKLNQLKVLESKLNESKKRQVEALRLRDIIEARLKLRIDLLKTNESRIDYLIKLVKEGALDEQDLELARAQLKTLEALIDKTRSDGLKVSKFLDEHSKKLAKEESDLSQLKIQINLDSKN